MRDKKFIIRETNSLDELRRIEKLQSVILGYPETHVIGSNELSTIKKNGGATLIAYDEQSEKAIGFLISLVGFQNGEIYQHLLLMGVLTEYRSIGIGFELISKQIEYVKRQGIEYITTYIDPLEGGFSKLIIGKFHGKAIEYFPNLFGSDLGGMNMGLDADRLVVKLDIQSNVIRSSSELSLDSDSFVDNSSVINNTALRMGFREIINYNFNIDSQLILVELPYDIQKIKMRDMKLAQDWRLKIRDILETLIPKYNIVDFISKQEKEIRNFFVLELSK